MGHIGTLSPSVSESAILVDPSGTLSPSDSDPVGPYVTGGPVGHIGTLFPSASESGVLVDPGGMFPSSDLAVMPA